MEKLNERIRTPVLHEWYCMRLRAGSPMVAMMKATNPLYLSFRESFSKDFYLPQCGVVGAPVVIMPVENAEALEQLCSECPPQNAVFFLDEKLNVTDPTGRPLTSLYRALQLCTRTLPILRISSRSTPAALAAFLNENRVADAILCASYADRALLTEAYRAMPVLRCMMDCRGVALPEDISELPGVLVSHGAVMVILDEDVCTRRAVHALQQRFIHVVCPDTQGIAEAAAKGVNGILTSQPSECYRLLERFPQNSFLRSHNLYAHKGFQNNGQFSENSVTGVRAAGEYGFDGAEIDVKLTDDLVPIVMHNLNTKGLFDCEEKVIEQTPYRELVPLRRIGFPNEGVDKFEDLMSQMKDYPETPVLIEFKPNAIYNRVEEMVAQVGEILSRPSSQQNCIGIMGMLMPGLGYVHSQLPTLPLSHCESVRELPPPQNRAEVEDRLYRIAFLTAGWAAGYNCEDTMLNRTFLEYAKMRGLTLFPWSRSWTLAPSLWEKNGQRCDQTYLAGYDAWTTDHGDMYLYLPVSLEPSVHFARERQAGERFRPLGTNLYRDHTHADTETELFVLEGELNTHADGSYSAEHSGVVKVMLMQTLELHFGDCYRIFSEPFCLRFL